MVEKLAIAKENGENINAEFISSFSIPEIQKHFVITTLNEIDPNGLVVLNVSELADNKLARVQNDDDWAKIKQVMRSIISNSGGGFKYNASMSSANAALDYARNISVQSSAKDQLSKDYLEKRPSGSESNDIAASDSNGSLGEGPINPAIGGGLNLANNEVAPGIVENPSENNIETVSINDLPGSPSANADVVVMSSNPQTVNPGDPTEQVMDIPQVNVMENTLTNINPVANSAQPVPTEVSPSESVGIAQNVYGNELPNMNVMPKGNGDYTSQMMAELKKNILDNVGNLVDAMLGNMMNQLRMKEEELKNREMMIVQREAAMMQHPQTPMMNMMPMPNGNMMNPMGNNQMPYGNVNMNMNPYYYNQGQYMNGQTQV